MFNSPKSQGTLDNSTSLIQLTVINKNILYITHEIDSIKKIVNRIENVINLQTQVDDYFESKTSPQTDADTN